MIPTTAWRIAGTAAILLCAAAACEKQPTAVQGLADKPNAITVYGCEMTPGCSDHHDPNPTAPGYWMGTTVTPALCFSPSGAGINDADLDGMSDYCEGLLADRFRPSLVTVDQDLDARGEPYWAAKYFPQHGNTVRIAYLFAYYQDGGVPSWMFASKLCNFGTALAPVLTFGSLYLPSWWSVIGVAAGAGGIAIANEDLCKSHRGDSEFITVDLSFDASSQHWYVSRAFYASHWQTFGDHSRVVTTSGMEYPEHYGGYPRVYVAEEKHGSFPTRDACSHDGGLGDNCDADNLNHETRVRSSTYYNVGSAQGQLLNCVRGGALVDVYPELYSTECFWDPNMRFEGWQPFRLGTVDGTSTGYFWILTAAFECYSWTTQLTYRFGTYIASTSCDDWGVIRQGYTPPPQQPLPTPLNNSISASGYTYTSYASGGQAPYSYLWEWCALDCNGSGGGELAAAPAGLYRTVAHGWLTIATTRSVYMQDSQRHLRSTVTDAAGAQAVAEIVTP